MTKNVNTNTESGTAVLESLNRLTPEQLERLAKVRREAQQVTEQLNAQIQAILGGVAGPIVHASFGKPLNVTGKKRGRKPGFKVSPQTKAKIAEAQRQRWAEQKAA